MVHHFVLWSSYHLRKGTGIAKPCKSLFFTSCNQLIYNNPPVRTSLISAKHMPYGRLVLAKMQPTHNKAQNHYGFTLANCALVGRLSQQISYFTCINAMNGFSGVWLLFCFCLLYVFILGVAFLGGRGVRGWGRGVCCVLFCYFNL